MAEETPKKSAAEMFKEMLPDKDTPLDAPCLMRRLDAHTKARVVAVGIKSLGDLKKYTQKQIKGLNLKIAERDILVQIWKTYCTGKFQSEIQAEMDKIKLENRPPDESKKEPKKKKKETK